MGGGDGEGWDTFVEHFFPTHFTQELEVRIYKRVSVWEAFALNTVIIIYPIYPPATVRYFQINIMYKESYNDGSAGHFDAFHESFCIWKTKQNKKHKQKEYSDDAKWNWTSWGGGWSSPVP